MVMSSLLGRRRDEDLLGTGVDVRLGLGCVREQAGRLDHEVDTQLAPWQIAGIALRQDLHGPLDAEKLADDVLGMNNELALSRLDVVVETAVHGVVLEKMSEGLGVREVVDGHDLDRRIVLHGT